jgi:hypothetical protein
MTKIERNAFGAITNAAELTSKDVANQKVLCPECGQGFQQWPLGWDAHSTLNFGLPRVVPADSD